MNGDETFLLLFLCEKLFRSDHILPEFPVLSDWHGAKRVGKSWEGMKIV